MDINTVRKRLTKLLALSASPNKAEAELAMEKCQQLMEQYGIRTIDVNEVTKEVDTVVETIPGYSQEHTHWESKLAANIADPFDAVALVKRNLNGDGTGWGIIFVATKTDYEFINHLYKHLRRAISKQAKAYVKKVNNGQRNDDLHYSYCIGICETIHTRLTALYKGVSDERALVPYKKKALSDLIAKLFGTPPLEDEQSANNYHAMFQGLDDGKALNLGRPIAEDKRRKPHKQLDK